LIGSFRGPPIYKTIALSRLRELEKILFPKDRFISFVSEEIIEARIYISIILGILSGSDDEELIKLFTVLTTSTSEAGFHTIDLRQFYSKICNLVVMVKT